MKIKKIFNLIMIVGLAVLSSNTNVYSQKKSKKNSVTFEKVLHESVAVYYTHLTLPTTSFV